MALIHPSDEEFCHARKRFELSSTCRVRQEFYPEDNWESYSKQLEQYFIENNIPDDKRVAMLLTVVSSLVYEVLKDLCHPELPQLKTYKQLSKLLETRYSPQAFLFENRNKFHEAKQVDNNEDVNEWLTRITKLAIFCEFGKSLDTMLRDKFVSGLADQRIVTRLCEENNKAMLTFRNMVDIAAGMQIKAKDMRDEHISSDSNYQKQPTGISSSFTNILKIPDDIWIKIISFLYAKERLPLGNTCRKFNHLVFHHEEVLRDLDFSGEGHVTSMSDIRHYFHNENTCKHMRKVNIRNVSCMRAPMLPDSIGRAMNLVDICLNGIEFRDICQLATFLNPLIHVTRLSIDWPVTVAKERDIPFCHQILQRSFSKLIYLSVKLEINLVRNFLSILQLCQELKELYLKMDRLDMGGGGNVGNRELEELKNLEIVQCFGHSASIIIQRIVTMLREPEKWTIFDLTISEFYEKFYLKKSTEVCAKLAGGEWIRSNDFADWLGPNNLGCTLLPELLLEAVLKITHENVPEKFCCLSTFRSGKRCVLNTRDAKLLMKNPGHQISGLYIGHDIERSCDIHLIASAFKNLTQLSLTNVVRHKVLSQDQPHPQRCLRKRGSVFIQKNQEALPNLDSAFKLLVDNSPHMKHLTMNSERIELDVFCWDLDALYLIPGWKNLETLSLISVPIENGEFLVEIAKQCKNLEKLVLINLGPDARPLSPWCYKEGLFEMLPHCRNLKEFLIQQHDIGYQMSELFTQLLKNLQLRKVHVKTRLVKNTTAALVSAIKQLLQSCSKLGTLLCEMDVTTTTNSYDQDELRSAFRRLGNEFSHRNLELRVIYRKSDYTQL